MKLKNKILHWGLLSLATISAIGTLAGIYSVSSPVRALAADASAPITLQSDSQKGCVATVNAPGSIINAYQGIDNAARNGGQNLNGQQYGGPFLQQNAFQQQGINLSAEAKKTIALGNAVYITFKGVNSRYDAPCSEAMFLIQSPDSQTQFYGFWFNPVNGSYQEQDATLTDTKAGALQFNLVYSTFNKSFTVALNGYSSLPSSLFTPPSGGGSGSVGDGSCVVTAGDANALKTCVDNASTSFKFTNAATITFGKDVYKATDWGYQGQDGYKTTHIEYMLDSSGYVGRQVSGKVPELDLDTTKYDINIDDLNATNIEQFFTSLSSAATNGHVNMTFKNFNQSGEEADYNNLSVNSSKINVFAGYYPKDSAVATFFTGGGTNESHYITKYTHGTGLDYALSDGTAISGCTSATSKPLITLESDPSALPANSIVPANWNLPDSTCAVHSGKILVQVQTADSSSPSAANDGSGTPHDSNATCDTNGDPLNWILCPVFNSVAGMSDWLFNNIVVPFLHTSPISTDPSDPTFKVWSNFRVYGNLFLVIALLVVVFGQAIGGGMIDAYTAKKVLPRLLTAAILINLSIYIVAFAVDMTNIVAGSIGKIMTQPLAGAGAFNISPSGIGAGKIVGVSAAAGIGAILLGFAAKAVIIKALMPILLFVIMPAVLGMIAAFLTLVIRKGIILALVMVSPVAFALYCLPNTEKYFRKWWDFLFQTLLVYPIVVIFFAVADILSVTIVQANGSSSGLALLVSFLLQFLPLLFISYAFRLAGGAVGKLHEVMTSAHKRAQEGIKGNVNDPNSLRNQAKRRLGEATTRAQNQVVQRGRRTDANVFQRGRSRFAGRFGNVDSRMSGYNADAAKRLEQLQATGDDALVYAGAGWKENGQYFDAKGRNISKVTYDQGKRLYGDSQHSIAQGLGYALRKAQTDEDVGNFRKAFANNAIAENWDDYEAGGVWAAATYPNKTTHASEWYSAPKLTRERGADGRQHTSGVNFTDVSNDQGTYSKLVNDLHKARTTFDLSRTRDVDWRAMADNQTKARQKLANGETLSEKEAQNFVMTSEILDTMGRENLGMIRPDPDHEGDVMVSGVSAASVPIIQAMHNEAKNSEFKAVMGPTADTRQIVRSQKAAGPAAPGPGPGGTGGARPAPVVSVVQDNIHVTGNTARTDIPRGV